MIIITKYDMECLKWRISSKLMGISEETIKTIEHDYMFNPCNNMDMADIIDNFEQCYFDDIDNQEKHNAWETYKKQVEKEMERELKLL